MKEQTASKPFGSLSPTEQIVEIFYQRALELTKVAYNAINRAYPLSTRKENPRAQGKYQEAVAIATQHRNFHKNKVSQFTTALCKVTRHIGPYDFSQDRPTKEFRAFIEGQFMLLQEKLIDYADVLMPEDEIPAFCRTLEKVFSTEKDRLLNETSPEGLVNYEITPLLSEDDFKETVAPQYTVHRRTKAKLSELKGKE